VKLPAWFAPCALAASLLGPPVAAQSPPSTTISATASAPPPSTAAVTLAAAVDAAWQRAVVARETHGQRQRAEADRRAASSLWAAPPALELNHRDDRWQRNAGQRETEIGLAWPLWLPGQRAARGAAAEAGVALADQAQAAARLRIAGEVREAAWAWKAHQAEAAQADALVDSLKALADDVERRVRAGDLARADALAARAELLGAVAQQSDAQQRLLAVRTRWELLTGLDAPPLFEAPTPVDAAPAPDRFETHPELRLAAGSTEHARRRLEALRTGRRDAPELKLGVRQEVPGRAEPSQGSLAVGLRVPFGTADRNQPLEAAALAELDVAQTSEQRWRERLAAEASAARAATHAAEQQLGAERDRAALLRERAQLIDKSFRAGESPLPDLLRALAAAAQADAALARQQAALGLARARLQQALGLLP
jgi:cobalt-zinc-cadmium efflux system outer membrane protein